MLEAKEIARILRQNVVQGEKVTGSTDKEQIYRAQILPARLDRHSVEPERFLARLPRARRVC